MKKSVGLVTVLIQLLAALGFTAPANAYQRGVVPSIVSINYLDVSDEVKVIWSVAQGKPAEYKVVTHLPNGNTSGSSSWLKVPGSAGSKGFLVVLTNQLTCAGYGDVSGDNVPYYEVSLRNTAGVTTKFLNCLTYFTVPTAP